MISEIKVGRRYNALLSLVSYANKCNSSDPDVEPVITYEELYKDALFFLDWYERLTDKSDNHFTIEDVNAALSIYGDKFVRMSRDYIEEITRVTMPVNKRNYRKRSEHRKIARYARDVGHPNNTWGLNNGHQSKGNEIEAYIATNQGKNPTEYAKALGVSRTTIYKYLKSKE
jgi:hypothetical protein